MKKVLLAFVLLGLLSCSSNDDNNKKEESTIIGNWKYIGANTYGSEQVLTKCDKELSYIEFKIGNGVIDKKGNADSSNESGCTQFITNGNYTINDSDKELIISIYKEGKLISTKNYFITELKSTSLKLKIFKTSYFNNQNVWIEEGLPEIKRTIFSYSK